MSNGPEFFQTVMGRQFYDGTLPRLVKALERIAVALEKPDSATTAALERIADALEKR